MTKEYPTHCQDCGEVLDWHVYASPVAGDTDVASCECGAEYCEGEYIE